MIGGGGLVRKAAKQPIIYVKRLRVKVKNWGGAKAPLTPLVLPTLIPTANLPPRNSLPNVLGLFPKCGKNNEIVRPIIVTYHFPYNQNLFFLLESGVWARD